ncbi:MAG: substrate-binding domain-containing protein, partial [Oscillospiraceae bacterium]|nr:substrate-binding domain-containing protein [Oscillospiraceae bacterium]
MKLKKLSALLLSGCMVLSMAACGSSGTTSTTSAAADNGSAPATEASTAAADTGNTATAAADGEVSVFYYTFADTYISSVRTALDAQLDSAGIKYTDYDGNGNQTTQTEAIQTAISKGTSMLIVNLVDSGSEDAANNIINMAKDKDIPVVFFNRAVSTAEDGGESVISSYDKCAFIGTDYEMAGHMQGQMIGDYLVANYDKLDLNG